MLQLREFNHNHHPSRVKILAKNIRRGISVITPGWKYCQYLSKKSPDFKKNIIPKATLEPLKFFKGSFSNYFVIFQQLLHNPCCLLKNRLLY